MPALSPTMEDGMIAAWVKKEGAQVKAGEAICEIETDKATVDFELQDDGIIAKILVPENQRVKVGEVIGILVENQADVSSFKNVTKADLVGAASSASPTPAAKAETSAKKQEAQKPTESEPEIKSCSQKMDHIPYPSSSTPKQGSEEATNDKIFISPLAKKTASEKGITVESLRGLGSGPNGRVISFDVLNFKPTTAPVTAPRKDSKVESNTEPKESISSPVLLHADDLAKNLAESKKSVPHYYLNIEVDVTELLKLKSKFEKTIPTISIADFSIKAASIVMKKIPSANSSFQGTFIRQYVDSNANLFFKKDDKTSLGLIKSVQSKGLGEISSEANAFKLAGSTSQLQLGTFSVVDLSSYGVHSVFPIVVLGQSICLGLGGVEECIVPKSSPTGEISYTTRKVLSVSLSCDHRVVDGAVGAQWLQNFKALLEDPTTMLI